MSATDKVFAGSIPQVYDEYMVPLIFEPYAQDLAKRVAARAPASVLEIAAGTGVVTRVLSKRLPATTTIVATDLNAPMIERAKAMGTSRPVEWRQADAMSLPFPDASFDAVACQFGAMFFPDKAKAFAETRRVLRPGGAYLFNVWDRVETTEFADIATRALAELFPSDAPVFMVRVPHGYNDKEKVRADLASGGFTKVSIETLTKPSRAHSARRVAIGYCQGTPLRNEIEKRDPNGLARATDHVERAIARRFGNGVVEGTIQAHVIVAEQR
jgi:ubiquinone/menaquinone biosynthesis C-methylase UbiE